MPGDLVRQAIEQARGREPVVATMALLHGARVLAAVDRDGAKVIFAEGAALAEKLAPGRIRDFAQAEAVRLGADADPLAALALFRGLPHSGPDMHHQSAGRHLLQALAECGEIEAAVELLEDLSCPTGGASVVVHRAPTPELRRRAMAAARVRWRLPGEPFRHPRDLEFFHLFSSHWTDLDPAEQLAWLDEILQAIEAAPDSPMGGGVGEVPLRSTKDLYLFHLLNVMRALKPSDEIAAILRRHPDVAKAAEVYPLGWESYRTAAVKQSRGTTGGSGWIGSARNRPLMEATIKSHQGDPTGVTDMLDEARSRFLVDNDPAHPQRAFLPFWPACRSYQAAMYWAGQTLGMGGTALLSEIPAEDIALFGRIELAAGVLGLPEYSGIQMGRSLRLR